MIKKIDYISIIAFLGCAIGMVRYLILYINNKQTLDLIAFIIISIVLIPVFFCKN